MKSVLSEFVAPLRCGVKGNEWFWMQKGRPMWKEEHDFTNVKNRISQHKINASQTYWTPSRVGIWLSSSTSDLRLRVWSNSGLCSPFFNHINNNPYLSKEFSHYLYPFKLWFICVCFFVYNLTSASSRLSCLCILYYRDGFSDPISTMVVPRTFLQGTFC